MKHCQPCNLDFPSAYRFCGSCGGGLSDSIRCPGCGELAEAKWTFCTSCGGPLSSESKGDRALPPDVPPPANIPAGPASSLATPSQNQNNYPPEQQSKDSVLQEWYAAPDLFEETTQTTATPILRHELVPTTTVAAPQVIAQPQARNGKAPPTLTMLAAYGKPETDPPEQQSRSALLVGLLFLVLVAVLAAGGWYWWTHRAAAAQSQPQVQSTTAPRTADSTSSSTSATTTAPKQSSAGNLADEEWKRLREKRIGAKPSDNSAVIASLDDAEKKYPRDYRFPYERAKLSIKGITSHHEAFGALMLAADKAIDNGKAQEMLDGLKADQDGDFYKLSRGHHEWQMMLEALSNKDKRGLSALQH
jgi:hypothetical protein